MKKATHTGLLQLCGNEHLLLLSVFGDTELYEAINRELHNRAAADTAQLHWDASPCLAGCPDGGAISETGDSMQETKDVHA